ncbi:MAG: hypothetical protein WA982_01905 [Rubrobacteraceae bacterium]
MISIERETYERRVLATLRGELVECDSGLEHAGNRIIVEDVRLEKSEWPHQVHILFREESRPRCLFGLTALALEKGWDADPTSDTIDIDPSRGYLGPEEWASIFVVTRFMEQVEALGYGLPEDCDPEVITWVDDYRSPYSD